MKIQIVVMLEPNVGPCQMTTFEHTHKRGIGEHDLTTEVEAVRAAQAMVALTADALMWIAQRAPSGQS